MIDKIKAEIESLENQLSLKKEELKVLLSRQNKSMDLLIDLKEDDSPFRNWITGRLWIKKVTGLDKTKTNGYSVLGDFVQSGRQFYRDGQLYLICDGHRSKGVMLFTISLGEIKILADAKGQNWATDLWGAIENNLPQKNEKESPSGGITENDAPSETRIPGLNVPCPKCKTYCCGDCE